jgi:hypothetical protein
MDFDNRTEKEKKKDKIYFNRIKDIANELIVYCFHENHGDVDYAIQRMRIINSKPFEPKKEIKIDNEIYVLKKDKLEKTEKIPKLKRKMCCHSTE